MKELYLRECNNTFYKQDKKRKYSVYHDLKNNNLIVFNPFDDCTVDSVCCSISNEAYLYLIKQLNTKRNLVIDWSQVNGTTSDYTIFFNMDVEILKDKSHNEILKIIYNSITNPDNCCGYKYTEVKNGIVDKITPEMMYQNTIVYVFDYTDGEYLN